MSFIVRVANHVDDHGAGEDKHVIFTIGDIARWDEADLARRFGKNGRELARLAREQGLTVMFVTHDLEEALYLGDRVIALRGNQAVQLANIEANYKTLIQANSSASEFYKAMANNIGAIQADPKLSDDQRQKAMNTMNTMLKSGLTIIGATANLDLTSLLDFEGAGAINGGTADAAAGADGASGASGTNGADGGGAGALNRSITRRATPGPNTTPPEATLTMARVSSSRSAPLST